MAIADLISTLTKHQVEFVIVGGMAAVLRGTPVSTTRVHLRLDKSHLESAGHKLMETNQGPLDLLGTIEENTGFDGLVTDSGLA